jgi:hypothetical protein
LKMLLLVVVQTKVLPSSGYLDSALSNTGHNEPDIGERRCIGRTAGRVAISLGLSPSEIVTMSQACSTPEKLVRSPPSGLRVPIWVRNQKSKKAQEKCLFIVKLIGED